MGLGRRSVQGLFHAQSLWGAIETILPGCGTICARQWGAGVAC